MRIVLEQRSMFVFLLICFVSAVITITLSKLTIITFCLRTL